MSLLAVSPEVKPPRACARLRTVGEDRLANGLLPSGDGTGARSSLRAATPGSAFRRGTPPGDLGDCFHLTRYLKWCLQRSRRGTNHVTRANPLVDATFGDLLLARDLRQRHVYDAETLIQQDFRQIDSR